MNQPDDHAATANRFRSLTLLISDMVGSTDLRDRLGADGERLVRLHETIAREAVAAAGGTFVKGLGDGAMAVFEAAADAVAAAVRLQRQIDGLHRRGEARELVLRIGISAGDVSVGPDDCYGLPVAEAVRLCAAAEPAEILVADVVKVLARRLDVPLTNTGERALRGLHEPVTAWRVEWQARSSDWGDTPLPPRLATTITGPLVGRATEVDRLLRAAQDAANGQRKLHLVTGEPGAGKSALVAEAARQLHANGAIVLHGGCDEELRPPYQPFAAMLRHLVRHAPTSALDDHVRRHGGDLAVLVPELVDRVGRVPPPRSTAHTSDRYLLFGAVTGLLEVALSQAPIVMVIDDLQWADRGTLLLLRHLLGILELPGLFLVATVRDGEAAADLDDVLAELHRVGGVERMSIEGLGADEVRTLVVQMLGDAGAAQVARVVHRETDGNPFFAIELLRHLRESREEIAPQLTALPASVRDVVRRRIRRLGDDVGGLLSVAAVLGAEFHLAAVADLAEMPSDTALDLLERATQAAVLREVPGSSRFRFVHALVQHTLYDELSHTRRRRLHRSAAETLERVYDTVGTNAATIAAHWIAAGDMADALATMAACTAAADEALQQRAPDEAARWYAEALAFVPQTDGEVRCELLLRLGEAERLAGDPAHRQTLADAAALARAQGDASRLARAALARTRWFSPIVASGGDAEQLDLLDAALAAVQDDVGVRARLLATLTAELLYTPRTYERFETADEALRLARESGDPEVIFDVLFWRALAARAPGRGQTGEEEAELHELAATLQDPLRTAMADVTSVLRAFILGDLDGALPPLHAATELAADLRVPVLHWLVTVLRATYAIATGDLVEGERLAMQGLELSQATDQPDTATWFGVQLYMIRLEQSRLAEITDLFAAALSRASSLYTWHAALALALTETGEPARARELVAQMMAVDYPAHPGEPHWLVGMSCLGSTVAALGDVATAKVVYDALAPCAAHWASIMPLTLGSNERVLGSLALALGRPHDAERHFRAAIASNDAGGAVSFAARSRVGLVDALLQQGAGAADAELRRLIADVRGEVERHGLVRVGEQLDAVLAVHEDDVTGAMMS